MITNCEHNHAVRCAKLQSSMIKQMFCTSKTLELPRKAESYFQHTESTFSSDTRRSMKCRIIAKHLTEPK